MKILVTGSAGFIGFHLTRTLLERGEVVIGIDNINSYYDVGLKYDRLYELGIEKEEIQYRKVIQSKKYPNFTFQRLDITNKKDLISLFNREKPTKVCNLAAQAGVRFSISHPDIYLKSNVEGFLNLLEECRKHQVELFIYASSSSVYGLNREQPYTTSQRTDSPMSLYAATKKTNELIAHTYSYLYNIPTIGLRFFTVYGPWGRPDMSPVIFAKSIIKGSPINIYNHGKMYRDFTYIDDIVHSISLLLKVGIDKHKQDVIPYELYNIGNGNSVCIMDFISMLELYLGKKANKQFLPKHDADMISTLADTADLMRKIKYKPTTPVEDGVRCFSEWFIEYYRTKISADKYIAVS